MRFKCFSLFFYSVLFCFSFISAAAFAGDMTPANPPASTLSYTLEAIYQRLLNGTAGTQNAFTEPAAGPGATGYTLDDVMGKAPAKDETDGATVTDVVKGKTFWGLTGTEWGLQTGTRAIAPVEKTGQTACYNNTIAITCGDAGFPGQDGDKLAGVAWPTDRFTDNGNGTVTDNLTGLMWLKDANFANTVGHDPDSIGNGKMKWENALLFIKKLNDGVFDSIVPGKCGYTDWRLPNLKELSSLVHLGYSGPCLSNDAGTGQWTSGAGSSFTNIQFGLYWSSATYVSSPISAWVVDMFTGYAGDGHKLGTNSVWPVRGGQ